MILCDLLGYILRNIEVLLCIRKKAYKTHIFPRKTGEYEYYHNREKFRQRYA